MDIFLHWVVVKIELFAWKRPKINEKEAEYGPFFKLERRRSVTRSYIEKWPHFAQKLRNKVSQSCFYFKVVIKISQNILATFVSNFETKNVKKL